MGGVRTHREPPAYSPHLIVPAATSPAAPPGTTEYTTE